MKAEDVALTMQAAALLLAAIVVVIGFIGDARSGFKHSTRQESACVCVCVCEMCGGEIENETE